MEESEGGLDEYKQWSILDGRAKWFKDYFTGVCVGGGGVYSSSLKEDNIRTILFNHDDFLNEKTEVEHYIENRGFRCFFLPKFHCELNPIERVWGQSKQYGQAYSNFILQKLRATLDPALDSASVDVIRKYYRKTREWRAIRQARK